MKKSWMNQGMNSRTGLMRLLTVGLTVAALCGTGGTAAYLISKSDTVMNVFAPVRLSCVVKYRENEPLTVANDGNVNIFVRVRLVSYLVDDEGDRMGEPVETPAFDMGTGWKKIGTSYYYQKELAPGEECSKPLIEDISKLKIWNKSDPEEEENWKLVTDVLAEAIQSSPISAVEEAWGPDAADYIKAGMMP
ncbi:MAG: hypothetical protein Q4C73_01025 [Eubacteriales bacterium]|nr:hypothetical protein [Eubacteriales bacterium]